MDPSKGHTFDSLLGLIKISKLGRIIMDFWQEILQRAFYMVSQQFIHTIGSVITFKHS